MKHDELLDLAKTRLDLGLNADRENREAGFQDLRFHIGEQWADNARSEREAANKPCITINQVAQFVRQVTGQVRALNPAIKISPGDNVANDDVADIYEGLIRQIEYGSDATSVYEAAAENAAACGIGHFRIRADYCDDNSFDQTLLLDRIHDPFAVVWDPYARESTRKDAMWGFILERMGKDEFEASHPGKKAMDVEAPSEDKDDRGANWIDGDQVIVAEYFWIEEEERKIGQMPDGSILGGKELAAAVTAGFAPVQERTATVRHVKWAKISGSDVLEGPTDIPGAFIPIVATTGEEVIAGDIRHRSGVIRYAKDAQVLYNYSRSIGAEVMQQQPKAPFIGTAKQFQGLENEWARAHTTGLPFVRYNPDEKAPGPPQRSAPPVASSAIQAEIAMAAEDMKRATGIYDASLGARSNETSGVAIDARKEESQNATSIYADNLVKAVAHAGNIIVGMVPKIYDTARSIRILGEDNQKKLETINQIFMTEDGPVVVNDMTVGKYDVRIGVGPKYSTRRQEAAEKIMEFARAVPQVGEIAPDIIAGSQEWPDAERLAERLKKTVPPQFLEEDDQSPEAQEQAQAAAQQQKAEQQAQMQMQQRMQDAEIKKAEAEADEAKADAIKAQAEAAEASGAIDAKIQEQVQMQLSALLAPQQPQSPMAVQMGYPPA